MTEDNLKTSFGYQTVTPEEKTELVSDVFKRIAKRYDQMNDLMSFGLHRRWKNELVELLRPYPGMHLLDMAGGTGDVACRFLQASTDSQVTVCDANEDMLAEGKRRAINRGIVTGLTWVTADAADLPFPDNTFDAYSISFGLRNVTHIDRALAEAQRVLKPGGLFACLEFSKIQSPLMNKMYRLYAFDIIPALGQVVAGDKAAYQYMVESIDKFPDQETLASWITQAGFEKITWRNLSNGVVALHSALKP
jgi:demethylmenaquinone methyltransferase/2-methoxy-6-polyprenyl-1,4-benzoquinol methylase